MNLKSVINMELIKGIGSLEMGKGGFEDDILGKSCESQRVREKGLGNEEKRWLERRLGAISR